MNYVYTRIHMQYILQIVKNVSLNPTDMEFLRFGLSMLRSVNVLVCWRFGLSKFRFVDVLVVDGSICRHFHQLPVN